MPISFSPADPYDPQIAYQSGQRIQAQQEFDNYLRAQQQAASQYAQQQQMAQSAQEHADQMDFRRQQFDQSNDQFRQQRLPSERDQFLAANELKQMQARADIHVAMRDQEVTQAEKMRLQQMQNAIAEVNADPNLTDEEKAPLITQLRTGIDPIQQRLKSQQAQMLQQRMKQMDDEAKFQAQIEKQQKEFSARNAPGSIIQIPGYGIGIVQPADQNGRTKIDFHAAPKPEREPHERPLSVQEYGTITKMANDEVEKMLADQAAAAGVKPEKMAAPSEEVRRQLFEKAYNTVLQRYRNSAARSTPAASPQMPSVQNAQPGPEPSPEPVTQDQQAAPIGSAASDIGAYAQQQAAGVRNAQPQPAAPPAPPPKPVPPLADDRKAWTPQQVQTVDAMDRMIGTLSKAPSMDKQEAAKHLAEAMKIYRMTGGLNPGNMTPELQQRYNEHVNQYEALKLRGK